MGRSSSKREEIYAFLKDYIASHGYPPTTREIMAGVGLRPPRNDKSGAGTVLTIACANRRFTAGRGMPLPYNAPSTAGSYIEPYTQRSISFPLF